MILSYKYELLKLTYKQKWTQFLHSWPFLLDIYRPKEINTRPEKWRITLFTLKEGNVLKKGTFGFAFLRLHTKHLFPICLIDAIPFITQNVCLIANNTYSVTKQEISYSRISSCTTYVCQEVLLNSGCLLLINFFKFSLYPFCIEMVLNWGACFSFIMVGPVSVLQDLFQILHAESILKVVFQLLQFLELSKSCSFSYLRFWHFNKIVSPNIWLITLWQLESFLYSKQCCLFKVAVTNISFFFISGLPSSILTMT